MHLTLTNIAKSAFTGGYQKKSQVGYRDDGDHVYIRGDIENRGPCPGLNALANQGYLYIPSFTLTEVDVLTCNHTTRREEPHPPTSSTRAHDGLTHGLARLCLLNRQPPSTMP